MHTTKETTQLPDGLRWFMRNLISLLITLIFLPSVALGACNSPNIDKSFLKPYESENRKWEIHDTYFYSDKRLGLSIKFKTVDTTVDFYIYDLGKSKINESLVDKELRNSIYGMIKYYETYEPHSIHSSPKLIPENYFLESEKNLIKTGVYIVVKKLQSNEVAFVSMGFDGKCFQKLRFTKKITSSSNIEQYFDNPTYSTDIVVAILSFKGFVNILNKQLLNSGYYK